MSVFADVRVLDFSNDRAAAMAGMHLGDLGAEVVKVDPTAAEHDHDEPGYLAWNRNKRRLVLDLTSRADLAVAKSLMADADVAMFDAGPGVLEPLGLDGATLMRAHERLVHAWAPPYGEAGRWASLPTSHNLLTALTGISSGQASYAGSPSTSSRRWRTTARPIAWPPRSAPHCSNACAGDSGSAWWSAGCTAPRKSCRRRGSSRRIARSGARPSAARQTIACISPRTVSGSPRRAVRGALRAGAGGHRRARRSAVGSGDRGRPDRGIRRTGRAGRDANARGGVSHGAPPSGPPLLAAVDVPSGPVRMPADWFGGETFAANGMRLELEHPELGTVEMPGVSLRMSGTPAITPRLADDVHEPWAAAPDKPPVGRKRRRGSAARGGEGARSRRRDRGCVRPAILAYFGVNVVKIETTSGDPFRSYRTGFCVYNRGKRGLVLDLKRPTTRRGRSSNWSRRPTSCSTTPGSACANGSASPRAPPRSQSAHHLALDHRLRHRGPAGVGAGLRSVAAGAERLDAGPGRRRGRTGVPRHPGQRRSAARRCRRSPSSVRSTREPEPAWARTSRPALASQSVLLQIGELTSYPGGPEPAMGARDCIGVSALERYYECADGWIAVACGAAPRDAALFEALGLPTRDGEEALDAPHDGELASLIAEVLRPLSVDDALTRLARRARRPHPYSRSTRRTRTHSSPRTTTTTPMWIRPSARRRASPASPGSSARRRSFGARRRPSANTASMCCASSVSPDAIDSLLRSARWSRARCRPSGVTHSDEQTQCERAGEAPAQGVRTSRERRVPRRRGRRRGTTRCPTAVTRSARCACRASNEIGETSPRTSSIASTARRARSSRRRPRRRKRRRSSPPLCVGGARGPGLQGRRHPVGRGPRGSRGADLATDRPEFFGLRGDVGEVAGRGGAVFVDDLDPRRSSLCGQRAR